MESRVSILATQTQYCLTYLFSGLRFRRRKKRESQSARAKRHPGDRYFKPFLCEAKPGNPDAIELVKKDKDKSAPECRGKLDLKKIGPDPEEPSADLFGLNKILKPDSNYAVCVFEPLEPPSSHTIKDLHCLRFSVAMPFLGVCTADSCSQLYRYIKDKNVVIFGVVDPELRAYVGRDNMSW